MRLDAALAALNDPLLNSSMARGRGEWVRHSESDCIPGSRNEGKEIWTDDRSDVWMRVEAFAPGSLGCYHIRSAKFTATVLCVLTDTWTVRSNNTDPFGLPGDSGSLIVREDGSRATVLLFAVNNRGIATVSLFP